MTSFSRYQVQCLSMDGERPTVVSAIDVHSGTRQLLKRAYMRWSESDMLVGCSLPAKSVILAHSLAIVSTVTGVSSGKRLSPSDRSHRSFLKLPAEASKKLPDSSQLAWAR